MVTIPAVEVQAEKALSTDENDVHVYCCRPEIALCGERLEGDFYDDEEPPDCIRCEVIYEALVPCGAPLCRLRRAWRVLRGRQ